MSTNYYVITPTNAVIGPFSSVAEAQSEIPDTHDTNMPDHATDMKGCAATLRAALAHVEVSEMDHVETWVSSSDEDPDETGYLIFRVDAA